MEHVSWLTRFVNHYLGGLALSAVKRSLGAKDWGSMIEGHGGMLDRIDALLFVSAWIYVYVLHLK